MREELLKLLEEICPMVDFKNEKGLIDNGKLESFAVLSILAAISEKYDIEFEADDILPEYLNDIDSICNMVQAVIDRKAAGK